MSQAQSTATSPLDAIEVRAVEGVGRAAFVRRRFRAGDVVFIERSLHVATPSAFPELWRAFDALRGELLLPLSFVAAASSALLCSGRSPEPHALLARFFERWSPPVPALPGADLAHRAAAAIVQRDAVWGLEALRACTLANASMPGAALLSPEILTVENLSRMLAVWRYNSFATIEPDGLMLFESVASLNHHCAASAELSVLPSGAAEVRATRALAPGEELTLSYLPSEALRLTVTERRVKLRNWLFDCACDRCAAESCEGGERA